MRKSGWKYILVFLVGFLFAVPLRAQNSASIQGTVVDTQGGVIPGASVQAIDESKGTVVRNTTTNGDGYFVLQPLSPGIYRISIHASGMKELARTHLSLRRCE